MVRAGAVVDGWITPARTRVYPAIVLVLFTALYFVMVALGDLPYDYFDHPVAVDLANRIIGARIVLDGDIGNLYHVERQWEEQEQLLGVHDGAPLSLFVSPPFVSFFYAPLVQFSYLTSAALWTILTIVCLLLSMRLLWSVVPGVHRYGFGFILMLTAASQPFLEQVTSGQDAAISLLIFVLVLRQLLAGRDELAGMTAACGLYKPQLFVLMPVLFLAMRRWRALFGWFAIAAPLAGFTLLVFGVDGLRSYADLLRSDVYTVGVAVDLNWKMQSLVAFLRAAGVGQILSGPAVHALNGVSVLTAALLLFWIAEKTRRSFSNVQWIKILYAVMILVLAVASPHFFLYDALVLLIPVLILIDMAPVTRYFRLSVAALFVLTWTTPVRHIAVGALPWPLALGAAPWASLVVLGMLWGFLTTVLPRLRQAEGEFMEPAAPVRQS